MSTNNMRVTLCEELMSCGARPMSGHKLEEHWSVRERERERKRGMRETEK
jgi:hypothetical protein